MFTDKKLKITEFITFNFKLYFITLKTCRPDVNKPKSYLKKNKC